MSLRRWLIVALATGFALPALGLMAPAAAAPGESDDPIDNPDLAASCGIDIHVILDESGSVKNFAGDVRDAFSAFTDALKNTGSRMAVSEFSTVARLQVPTYTVVTDDTIQDVFDPYIDNGYNPNGSTDWEDAFRVGRYFLPRPDPNIAHLTVFITDGDPNVVIRNDKVTYDPGNPNVSQNEYELKVPLSNDETTSDDENDAKDAAVSNANAIKATGSHILTVAVGAGLDSQDSLDRIIDVSGPDVFDGSGTFDITTDDVFRVEDFDDLEDALRDAAFQLCSPSVTVRKLIDLTPDPGPDDSVPGTDWDMTITASPTPADWVLPPDGTGDTATTTTDASGFATFQWTTSTPTDSDITIQEEDPGGVPPGFENDPSATSCTYRTPDQPDDQPLAVDATDGGFSATAPDESIVTCQMVNRVPAAPGIDLEKSTNGADADTAPGPFVPVGDPIEWTYDLTNTGNDTLSDIDVVDDQGVSVSCPFTSLAPGESGTCTADGTAAGGQYENDATATGTDPFGTEVQDSDPSHYVGSAPGIDVEKSTNGEDADILPVVIPVGDPVTWDYVVTNTGNVALSGVGLLDDQGVVPTFTGGDTDGDGQLDVDETWTYQASGTAEAGLYENNASAVGTDTANGTVVRDSDPSHYFGQDPSIDIEKSTNGEDADAEPGPFVSVGGPVAWLYDITNTGNVPLTWSASDDQGVPLACPRLLILLPGNSVTCFSGGLAQAGQYENMGTATGTTLLDNTVVTDSDPSHYFGVDASIHVEKSTNGEDADEAPGVFVAPGSPVNWTYTVTNTGNSDLTDVTVVDDHGVALSCPGTTLAAGDSMDCTGSGTAEVDAYTNQATATATTEAAEQVQDVDPSNYFGAVPGIDLQKSTNGVDADDAPGPFIPVGDPVTWSYVVTNSGNVELTDVTVTDDQGVSASCPQTVLAAGQVMTCTATGTSVEGQYENLGTATGTTPTQAVISDTDPSHYFGSVSEIHVEKSTNGVDADVAPGPAITVGDPVTWTYEVSNPGNVTITGITLTDSQGVEPVFVSGDTDADEELDPGETWTYEATGRAAAGQYENIATATGLDVLEVVRDGTDPSHYFGQVVTPSGGVQTGAGGTAAPLWLPIALAGLALVAGVGTRGVAARARRAR